MQLNRDIIDRDLREIAALRLPWGALSGRRVLVTGATGFIAAYLVETLLWLNQHVLERPAQVIALARSREKVARRFGPFLERKDFAVEIADVSVPPSCDLRPDYVAHCASPANPQAYLADPVGTLLANTRGTQLMLEAAQRSSARKFLFVSSGEVYGRFAQPPVEALTETNFGALDPLDPRSCYGEGKRAGEALAAAYWRQHGLPTVTARLGHTYGPGIELGDGRVFSDFVGNIVRGEPIEMKSAGLTVRPFCYVADAVAALWTLLLKGASGEAYNVMNDEAFLSVRELADLLAERFADRGACVIARPAAAASGAATDTGKVSVSTAKLRALGWRPRIDPREGFHRTVSAYAAAEPVEAGAHA